MVCPPSEHPSKPATDSLDQTMEGASQALVAMDYLGCERRCLAALATAREREDWGYYARILLPLQEARRQRRMIAADGRIRLGSAGLAGDPAEFFEDAQAPDGETSGEASGATSGGGCLVLTGPHTVTDAAAVGRSVRERGLHAEVLFAEGEPGGEKWMLRGFAGPAVSREVRAPDAQARHAWLDPAAVVTPDHRTAADWFIDASEALGDAAIAQVDAELGSVQRVAELEARLAVVSDHEKLHQRLAEAARAVHAGAR